MHLSRSVVYFIGFVVTCSVALNIWQYLHSSDPTGEKISKHSHTGGPTTPPRPLATLSKKSRSERLNRAIAARGDQGEIISEFAAWAESDPAAALEWAKTHTEGQINRELTVSGLSIWTQADPNAAAQWVDKLPQGAKREQGATAVLAEWGLTDGYAAAAWLETLTSGPLKISSESQLAASEALAKTWSSRQPTLAVEWARNFIKTHQRSKALHVSLTSFGKIDPSGARSYFNTLDHEETRAIAAESMGRGMAENSPKEALAWAVKLGSDETGWLARTSVIDQWSIDQPSQVADQISSILDDEERTEHIGTLITNWTASNANTAEQWAQSLPTGIDKDHAIKGLAENYAPASTNKALNLSISITDPSLRLEVTEGLLSWWREENRAEADAWFAETPMDPNLKTSLSELESDDSE